MPTPLPFALIGFGIGLLFGSFLNVCISRLPAHQSIVSPRSHCPSCGHKIRWYDNIPLLSWIVLRARCRDCKAGISWRYPAVELAIGYWFAAAAVHVRDLIILVHTVDFGPPSSVYWADNLPQIFAFAILGFLLIGLLVMDWQTQRLPDAFTLTGIGLGLGLVCVQAIFLPAGQGDVILNSTHQLRLSSPGSFASQGNVFLTGPEALVFGRIATVAAAALILLLVRWIYRAIRHREGMGLGDVKMLAMIAAFLGLSQTLLALFVGVLTASVYGVILLARRRAGAATRLPFGSFLAIGGLTAALIGPQVIAWYTGLLR